MVLRALLLLGADGAETQMTPAHIAEQLGCSPSYMSKALGQLVKAGILRSYRGARGGVALARPANQVTLLSIVEASQGTVLGNYCSEHTGPVGDVCAFHVAMRELHAAMTGVLVRWTLADFLAAPARLDVPNSGSICRMAIGAADD